MSQRALDWVIHTASEDWLVDFCGRAERDGGLCGGQGTSDHVVKLSDDIAVKYGPRVTASEAATQDFAQRKADPGIVHVPRVYRFFQKELNKYDKIGYLSMKYVCGQLVDGLDLNMHPGIIPGVARIIQHFGTIQMQNNEVPGPVGGDEPQGYIWGDDGARTAFTSRGDKDSWLNLRLSTQDKSIDLATEPLVLCHLDLCRRNMIMRPDGSISVVDWGFAGLCPRFFEIASLSSLKPYYAPYEKPLIEATKILIRFGEKEEHLTRLVQIAQGCNLRYSLYASVLRK